MSESRSHESASVTPTQHCLSYAVAKAPKGPDTKAIAAESIVLKKKVEELQNALNSSIAVRMESRMQNLETDVNSLKERLASCVQQARLDKVQSAEDLDSVLAKWQITQEKYFRSMTELTERREDINVWYYHNKA
ncbi:hypothetical protein BU23DRAFT_654442 [Bimuria novae-zelandiae CBS 107.79]|uniref:Uncharacterized protein n=1 Tax=Bimuria novae-zelandiae CBS 107.79 TaxID=1447943 RepID=A0A6A5VN06_9PLEO|nr:hypothetical protein BU23DRAFT_654442 [Bimuria novae-zelandiae CBS 107.79]